MSETERDERRERGESSETGEENAVGLTGIAARPLERVPIRRRGSQVTTAAWRLELTCDQGAGHVTRVEGTAGETYYRGDGLLLGWDQERLAELYRVLTAPAKGEPPDLDLPQLG